MKIELDQGYQFGLGAFETALNGSFPGEGEESDGTALR